MKKKKKQIPMMSIEGQCSINRTYAIHELAGFAITTNNYKYIYK